MTAVLLCTDQSPRTLSLGNDKLCPGEAVGGTPKAEPKEQDDEGWGH
jgi:hypothetical protein